jgi:hypothetical protein
MKLQLDRQMELERNGAPIDGAVAARMTKEQPDDLFQIWVEPKGENHAVPLGPMMRRMSCEKVLEAINRQIVLGNAKLYGNPHIVRCNVMVTH